MKKYSFFEFETGAKIASTPGKVIGMVNNETGEITARQNFGPMSYMEIYSLNINDKTNLFANTIQDRIIFSAIASQQDDMAQN